MARGYGRPRYLPGSWIFGALLTVAGTLLFLDNVGLLSLARLWQLWPLLLVAWGITRLKRQTPSDTVVGAALVVFGALFTLVNLGVIPIRTHQASWPLSIVLIIFGIRALQLALERNSPGKRRTNDRFGMVAEPAAATGILDDWVFVGGLTRRFDGVPFSGGAVHCVVGEIILDLRRSVLQNGRGPVLVEAHCLMGAIRLRVPEEWLVETQGLGAFGVFQDKTLGVRRREGEWLPTLIVTGHAVFGEVNIVN